MDFDDDNKVKPDTLNRQEAEAFVAFLGIELQRHLDAVSVVQAHRRFLDSAAYRHRQDVEGCEVLIKEVAARWNL